MKLRVSPICIAILIVCALQLTTSHAAQSSSTVVADATKQSRLKYWTFDPIVVNSSGNQSILLSIQTDMSTPVVNFVFADGYVRQLLDQGGGKFSITLTHNEALNGEWWKYVNRNYVGYLNLGDGDTHPISINIDDGSIPEVTVVDLDETTRISPRIVNFLIPHENPALLNIEQVTRFFYQYFPDESDFINIVSTKAEPRASYFINVKNSTMGLGLGQFDDTSVYGSSGRLEGVVRIPNLSYFDLAGREYLRMLGYNWMNYSEHSVLSGVTPHWPISTLASGIMGYQDQSSSEHRWFPYTFEPKLVGFPPGKWEGDYFLKPLFNTPVYNSMEKYLVGLVPASKVGVFLALQNPYQAVCFLCTVQGPLINYGVDGLQRLHGPRIPDASESRKNFKTATIVVSSDRLLSPQEIRHFDHMAARGEATEELPYSRDDATGLTHPFRTASDRNGSLDALIAGDLVANINEGLNGAWFDVDLPGQGFFVDVLPGSSRMVIGWFTFETSRYTERESRMGDPYHRWMTAVGEYSANRAELTLYRTIGGVFNSDTPVENLEIGKLVFMLRDCEHADIEYDIHSRWQGQISLSRIANDNVSWCEELQPNPVGKTIDKPTNASSVVDAISNEEELFQITAGLNGAWYNPDWPGQGFFIDVLPGEEKVFAGWFTFDTERLNESGSKYSFGDLNQRWLTALGGYQGNRAHLDLLMTSGGAFLSKQFPVTNHEYGILDLEFSDCETATVRYEIVDLGMSAEIPLKRVSNENTRTCELLAARRTSRP